MMCDALGREPGTRKACDSSEVLSERAQALRSIALSLTLLTVGF